MRKCSIIYRAIRKSLLIYHMRYEVFDFSSSCIYAYGDSKTNTTRMHMDDKLSDAVFVTN